MHKGIARGSLHKSLAANGTLPAESSACQILDCDPLSTERQAIETVVVTPLHKYDLNICARSNTPAPMKNPSEDTD